MQPADHRATTFQGRGTPLLSRPMRLHHICEACGTEAILDSEAAFTAGWDYPPRMGQFGVIGPRVCPNCAINRTVWWALAMEGYTADMLNPQQQAVIARIQAEPGSILTSDGDGQETC